VIGAGADEQPTLRVRDLGLDFVTRNTTIHVLEGISFDVRRGEILSIVGESGCGKSVTAMAIMGLLPRRIARITSGTAHLGDIDLTRAPEHTLRRLRGNRIGMIFQDPMTSLNPVHTIGMQIGEVVRQHRGTSHAAARARARDMLDLVRIPDATARLSAYPHELSGGMRQRVMIAMALACDPELLIADEPTTALDVTVQAQILGLIADLKTDLGMSVILITHDLGVVASVAERMLVMYAGRIVEEGRVGAIFERPSHGYTAGLLRALPSRTGTRRTMLAEISGSVPRLDRRIPGCTFADRCSYSVPACHDPLPPAKAVAPDHSSRCIRSDAVFDSMREHYLVRAWA
jgi:peptide/nickel transport system ATP-binding protein